VTADGLKARAPASSSAVLRSTQACALVVALGCARHPLPGGLGPGGRSGEAVPGAAVAVAEPTGSAPARTPPAPPALSNAGVMPAPRGSGVHEPSPLLCNLPDTAVEAPLFASNDANLRERGTQILDDVVACMKARLLGGHGLLIVGYADRRGPPLHNDAIALDRARTARRYLIRRGVPPERIQVASRGEREALGDAPESWLYDRRVEIRLLPKPEGAPEPEPVRKAEGVPEPEPVPDPASVPEQASDAER
jgi:outer membrane protein OmpA-like peptidoglycan-associated protein